MESLVWIAAIVVVGVISWAMGRFSARGKYARALGDLARSIERGEDVARSGSELTGVGQLRAALVRRLGDPGSEADSGTTSSSVSSVDDAGESRGVEPVGRATGDDRVMRSLERIRRYLEEGVEAPLRDVQTGSPAGQAVEDALIGLDDLFFYLRPIPTTRSSEDLNDIARDAGGEYRSEWGTDVDVHVPERRTLVEVDRDALMDAVYLALHNADTFGEREEMEVVVRYQDGDCWLVVRDRGPGFSDEALKRAFDPFFTTTDARLGLGLYQLRRIVESMGGRTAVRNRPGGGGQVEIVLPGRDD